jgi:hypothetical protein
MRTVYRWVSLLAGLALFVTPLTRADSWSYPPTVESHSFRHGSVRIVLTRDARTNQKLPDFLLEVFKDEVRMAQIPGVSFDKLFVSQDNRLFVGLSNSGIPGTAVVVFTDQGKLKLLAQHGLAEFDYCERSVTLARVWFDEENPSVRFQLDEHDPKPGIYLRSCKGQDIELVEAVREAFAKAGKSSS